MELKSLRVELRMKRISYLLAKGLCFTSEQVANRFFETVTKEFKSKKFQMIKFDNKKILVRSI